MVDGIAKTLLLAALIGSLSVAAAAAADQGRQAVQELVTLFAAWDGDDVDQSISNAAARSIDYGTMAERVLGEPTWSRLTATQRREFLTTFRKVVEQRYYPRWHKLFYKGRLNYLSEAGADGDIFVKTVLVVGKKEDPVVWRLHGAGGDWKVVSLSVGDKDLLRRLSERFQRHLGKDGFDDMLSRLKESVDDDDEHAGSIVNSPK